MPEGKPYHNFGSGMWIGIWPYPVKIVAYEKISIRALCDAGPVFFNYR